VGLAGFIVSLVAAFFMFIGLIPFLGIINWFTTLPLSILGAIFSGIGISKSRSSIGVAGLIISIAVFFIAVIRLSLGGGLL